MSQNDERPEPDDSLPTPSEPPKREPPSPDRECLEAGQDPTEKLKADREKTRLPAELREQILAELPPPEERERMYREMQEKGGLSAEEFFAALFQGFESQS